MWKALKLGSDILISDEFGERIATVGSEKDMKIKERMTQAKLMSLAPEMLEVIIDINELIKREYFEEHPLMISLSKKCSAIIEQSFEKERYDKNNDHYCMWRNKRTDHTERVPTDSGVGWNGNPSGKLSVEAARECDQATVNYLREDDGIPY